MIGVQAASRSRRRAWRWLIALQVALLVFSLAAPAGTILAADATDPAASASPAPSTEPTTPSDPTPSTDPAPSADPSSAPTPSPTPDPTAAPSSPPATPVEPEPTIAPAPTLPYVVTFVAGTSAPDQVAAIDAAGAADLDSIGALRMHAIRATDSAVAALRADALVASVELDRSRAAEAAPDDASYADQWSLPRIGWDQALDSIAPAGTAIVAILDTGVDRSHPDLVQNVVQGSSFVPGNAWDVDPNGHGTAMAGIVAASTGNGIGIAGVGYAGVRVMPVTVLGADGLGRDSDIIEGLVWATDHGADVALLAFSAGGYSSALQAAVDYAWSHGVVVVAATGNDGSSAATFPAGDRGVIGVASTDASDAMVASSNHGSDVFLAAPGEGILSTAVGGGYASVSGTSAAAAHVAGAAALLRAVDASAANGVIVNRLAESADAAGTPDQTGNGRLNLLRALEDASAGSVKPAGAAPIGEGGPFVGPYVAAARNWNLSFAGTGSGSVKITASSGTVNAPSSCGGTGGASASQTVTSTCSPNITTSDNGATITFLATANGGSTFGGWSAVTNASGSTCSGATNPCSLVFGGGGTITVTFNAATNAAPSIASNNATRTVDEGQTATNTGTWSDANAGDTVTLSASVGTVTKSGPNSGGTWSWSFGTTDGPAQGQTVTITADDGHGGITTTTFALNVDNVAATATFGAPASVNEGSAIALSLTSPVDPSSVDATAGFTYAFDCGAGYGPFTATSTASCPTSDNGSRTVKGQVRDKDGATNEYTASVSVVNVAPTIAISGAASVDEGSAYSLTLGAVTDPGLDTVTSYVVHWGDGSTDTYGANGVQTHAYADGPATEAITVDLVDEDGTFLNRANALAVSVANVAPSASITGAPTTSPEGTLISLGSSVNDASSADETAGFTYSWSVTKNGNPYGSTGASVLFSFTPNDNATYVVTLVASDKDGGTSTPAQATITVTNVAPSATIGVTSPVGEGSSATVSLTSPTDPSTVDAASLRFSFACDGFTGSLAATYAAAGTASSASCPFDDNGSFTVRARIFDKDGDFTDSEATVQADNLPPTGTFTPTTNIPEGSSSDLHWTSPSDPSSADAGSLHFKFACSSLSSDLDPLSYATGSTTNSQLCPYADNGTYGVEGAVIDKDDGSKVSGGSVVVTNVAPTVVPAADQSADEGSSTTFSIGSFSDPGVNDSPWVVTVDWGDGATTTLTNVTTQGAIASLPHTYDDNGIYTVSITVRDKDNGTSLAQTFSVTVANVAPTVDAGTDDTIDEGSTFTSSGSFSDPGADTWTATVDYGDGSGVQPLALEADNTFELSHLYADDGTFTVTVTVTDDDNGSDADTATVTVNNVAPTIAISGAASVDEGSAYSLTLGAVTDPGDDLVSSYVVHWGDGSTDTYGTNGIKSHTYDDGPATESITVDLVDEDGTWSDGANDLGVTVNNVAPTIAISGAPSVDEGSAYSLTLGSITDPGLDTVSSYVVHWGDGSTDTYGSAGAKAHAYADGPNNRSITVDLVDEDGTFLDAANDLAVTIDNVDPTVTAPADQSADEGTRASIALASFGDPGAIDGPWSVDVDWGDGSMHGTFATATRGSLGSLSHTYADGPDDHTVTVTVTDKDGGSDDTSFSLHVNNVAPTIAISGAAGVDEGSPYSLTLGAITDPGVDTVTSYVVHWGDGTTDTYHTNGVQTHTYADGPASRAITVDLVDEDGPFLDAANDLSVAVANVAPVVDAGLGDTIDEGSTFTGSGSFTDPGADLWTATVDYGDGSGVQPLALEADNTFELSHLYADDGTYTVTVTVTDDDGGTDDGTATVTVSNVAPTANPAADQSAAEGASTSVALGSFGDPGANDAPWSIDVDWGDGSGHDAFTTSSRGGLGSRSHTYADGPADHTVTVTVTDKDGGSDQASFSVHVSNVAPIAVITGASATSPEGTPISLGSTVIDPSAIDQTAGFSYVWSVTKNGAAYGSGGTTSSFTFTPDDNATFVVTLVATDKDGGSSMPVQVTITVTNVAPTVAISGAANVDEGSAYSLTLGAITDPGADTVTSYVVHWGDGSPASTYSSAGAKTHTYADGPNNRSITVDLVDEDGTFLDRANALSLAVGNVNPTIGAVSFSIDPVIGKVTATAPFTDPGVNDQPFSVTYTWAISPVANGTVVAPTVNQTARTVTGSLALPPGCYTISVTIRVTDKDGGVGTTTATMAGSADAYLAQFQAPIKDNERNLAKAGSVVPVKLSLVSSCTGAAVTNVPLFVVLKDGNVGEDPDANSVVTESASAADTGQQMRPNGGGYIYNLSTKSLTTGRDYTIQIRSGSTTGPAVLSALLKTQK